MRKLTIAHVWVFFHEELPYHVHFLARKQHGEGHQVHVVAGAVVKEAWKRFVRAGAVVGTTLWEGVQIHRLRVRNVRGKPVPYRGETAAKLRDIAPDVVHIFGLSQVLSLVVLSLVSRKVTETAIVVNDHSNPSRVRKGVLGSVFYRTSTRIVRAHQDRIQAVVVPNESTRKLIASRYPFLTDRLRTISLGYDETVFHHRPALRNQEDGLVLAFAGKVDVQKRVDRLIQAVHDAGLHGGVRCIVAGVQEGDLLDELRSLAQRLGVSVEWRPFQSPAELADLYAFADVAVYPGSISITTLEATACGTPVLLFASIVGLEDRVSGGRGELFLTDAELATQIASYHAVKRQAGIDHEGVAEASRPQSWAYISEKYEAIYQHARDSVSAAS